MARQSSRPSSRPAASRPGASSRSGAKKATSPAAVPAEEAEADDAVLEQQDALADEVIADEADADEVDADEIDDDEVIAEPAAKERSAQADAMWSDVAIEPVEIALPKGVGYTLRAYRLSNELVPTERDEDEEDDFAILRRRDEPIDDEEVVILDENAELFADEEPVAKPAAKKTAVASKDKDADAKAADEDDDEDEDDDSKAAAKKKDADEDADDEVEDVDDEVEDVDAEAEADEDDEEDEEEEPEEVPAFLSHRGKLLLFRSPEGLVEFVKSAESQHDLLQLSTWSSLQTQITASSVVPDDDDKYELDLVVENLRGGPDAWDSDLLIAAGEAARDLAHALRLEPVRTALSPGSPLDDLDEALRSAAGGGIGGFFAKRKLKKIGAQQAALGWRTIIGKISTAVDWRD